MAEFTPQEIEQFLQQFFDVVGARQYIGARYVPIFGRAGKDTVEWDDLAPYEPLTVVMHDGVSYVSRRYVPAGIEISNTAYWVETYRFNAQVEQYRQEVLGFQDEIDARVPFPDPLHYPQFGVLGQVLTTLADGTTKWENPVVPSDEQAEEAITAWLNEHPEATTTVQDGSITDVKMNANSFYGTDFMPRNWPSGETLLSHVVTPGIYSINSATMSTITDMPNFITSTIAGLIVFGNIYDNNYVIQVLLKRDTTYSPLHYRILNKNNYSVYMDWKSIATNIEIDELSTNKYGTRVTPIDITSLSELRESGSYPLNITVVNNVNDRPSDDVRAATLLVFKGALNSASNVIQLYIERDNIMYVRCLKSDGQELSSWSSIINNDTAEAYYQVRSTPSNTTLLSSLLSSGTYSINSTVYANLQDLPPMEESSTTGTLLVFTNALGGTYVLQVYVSRQMRIFVRYLSGAGATLVDWRLLFDSNQSSNNNILFGKKWAFCGDSFTAGNFSGYSGTDMAISEPGPYYGYASVYGYIIANRNNMVAQKVAAGGETLSIGTHSNIVNCFTNTSGSNNYTSIDSDVDYITIYYGINDSHRRDSETEPISIGSINDTNATTFYGAWNVVLGYLITHHPQAKIGIIVSNGCETDDYRVATIAIANKWGIPYIDLNGDARTPMMLRSTNPNITAAAKDARLAAWRVSDTNEHPNPAAHRYESTIIEAFLRSL